MYGRATLSQRRRIDPLPFQRSGRNWIAASSKAASGRQLARLLGCGSARAGLDDASDAFRIPADPVNHRRGERVDKGPADKIQTRLAGVHSAFSCFGTLSSPRTGRSIQEKPEWNPVHHMTLATSMTRLSSSSGDPARTPTILGTRSTPARINCAGLTRMSGPPCERTLGRTFRPIGVLTVSTRWNRKRSTKRTKNKSPRKAIDAERDVARVSAGHPRAVTAHNPMTTAATTMTGSSHCGYAAEASRRGTFMAALTTMDLTLPMEASTFMICKPRFCTC
jgi:hypothetical protein